MGVVCHHPRPHQTSLWSDGDGELSGHPYVHPCLPSRYHSRPHTPLLCLTSLRVPSLRIVVEVPWAAGVGVVERMGVMSEIQVASLVSVVLCSLLHSLYA